MFNIDFDMLCELVKRQLTAYSYCDTGDGNRNGFFVLATSNPDFNLKGLKTLYDNGTIEVYPLGEGNCSLRFAVTLDR